MYDAQCASCHGTEGTGLYPIDASKMRFGDSNQMLVDYIVDTMPPNDAVGCYGTCADDIAAYIEGWNSGDTSGDSTSQTACGVTYGPRSIRVLTRSEFVNSIEDLTGLDIQADLGQNTYDIIPVDNMISGFSFSIVLN
ncbi:MAG: cytochrome c [Candidatus Thiodiazotropha sp.]